MTKIFPTVIRRVTTIISGAANYLGRQHPATRLSWVGVLVERIRPASRVTIAPARLVMSERPASRISTFSVAILGQVLQRPAARLNGFLSGATTLTQRPSTRATFAPFVAKTLERPATNMTEAFITGEHKSFVVTFTNDLANTRNWTALANAQGANNGTNANWDGSLSLAQLGTMHGTLVAQPNRGSMVIDAVYLAVWGSWSGLPVIDDLLSGLTTGYRIGGITALDVQVLRRGVSSGSDVGTEVRIDNSAGAFTDTLGTAVTWTNIAALEFWAKGQTLIGVSSQFNIDAMRLRVVFHETVAL